MIRPNFNYREFKDSYLFSTIYRKTDEYLAAHPGAHVLNLGVGDVSLPISRTVIAALHAAVEEQAHAETFHGYLPECGLPGLRKTIAAHYGRYGVELAPEEVFVSSGAIDDIADILALFDKEDAALVLEPTYPAYVESNLIAGHPIKTLDSGKEDHFLPLPGPDLEADIIYLCSPGNPTGAAYDRDALKVWVDFANSTGAVILFDAAYEIFVSEPQIPHSIYEIEGAKTCAIEICSLSKTAGFTGMRLGYTVVPKALERQGMNLNAMWTRDRTSKTNGVSYILQKGAEAVFTEQGWEECLENINRYHANSKALMEALDEAGAWYCGGKNSPYVWVQCPHGLDSWTFFDRLLNEHQIVGVPGEGFGKCGAGFFRLTAFASKENTEKAPGFHQQDRLREVFSRPRMPRMRREAAEASAEMVFDTDNHCSWVYRLHDSV